jgi:hypothetical protein
MVNRELCQESEKGPMMTMKKATLKEIKVKLPALIAGAFSDREILSLMLDKALGKAEYYLSRCKEMAEKCGTDFASFKKRVEESEEEVFSEWDDLLLWEGYEASLREWQTRYEEIKRCMP